MPKVAIVTTKEWMELHPYTHHSYTDVYYQTLATKLFKQRKEIGKECAMAISAYLEDIVSNLNLWKNFRRLFRQHYGQPIPFYKPSIYYDDNSTNLEDIKIIVWLYMQSKVKNFINPHLKIIDKIAEDCYRLIEAEFHYAPINTELNNLFNNSYSNTEQETILQWLINGNYLSRYLTRNKELDYYTPIGPLALSATETLRTLTKPKANWNILKKKRITEPISKSKIDTNKDYISFTLETKGCPLAFFKDIKTVETFLFKILNGKTDEYNQIIERLTGTEYITLMSIKEKGILFAPYSAIGIKHVNNPFYKPEAAEEWALQAIFLQDVCPPELQQYCFENELMQFPTDLSKPDMDFICRSMLKFSYTEL